MGNDLSAQSANETYKKPKLVVGIVVDQMRYDYLPRFWNRYGEGGFKRMIAEGFNCKNNHFNYVPTYTGPGHASVYTGTTPAFHGIIANDWYDKNIDKSVYCAQDDEVNSVGTKSDAGKMSPNRMITTTVTDQLRLATQMRGKVIGIAIKDRGAILPAGHSANAAYWFHGKDEGAWISSTYYMDELPKWVQKFNKSDAAKSYKKEWNTLFDINSYTASGTDENNFEGKFKGEEAAVFPHKLHKLWKQNNGYDIIKATPYGNSVTTDFAIAAIEGESLGQDNDTDFLAVSYSSTDYVGHKFGVNSVEIEDTYLRLDKDLERLFNKLDKQVGKGNYTVFLTADHAAVHVPAYLESVKIPGGYFSTSDFKVKLNEFLQEKYNAKGLIKNFSNFQIFLDHEKLEELDLELVEVEEAIADEVVNYEGVFEVFTAQEMRKHDYTQPVPYLLQKGYNHKRSGDVLVVLDPGVISYSRTGSTHGSNFNYDTHAPLLFFGYGINHGETTQRTEIPDIAPTISALLGIAFPNAATGNPISEVID
ncbi:alkaline phosphatase family protein [Zhouia spongiae]|uniref:Alkaline phosphatase family protein n=1 Tax=Zhouia spongiae TaxID=2202721 RepID=A0ABY3YRK9_9FLAO|nr:alkaline phosphatase PafA [Zhouia spongiae]UNZ00472.1 alkaline phosphatase family protein [Zhouia spongiae]